MKTKLITALLTTGMAFSLFLPHQNKFLTSGVDLTIDSGWFASTPSNRSAGVLGQDVCNVFSGTRPNNTTLKVVDYAAELVVAYEFEFYLHELGHANYAKNHGGTYFFDTGDHNWFAYMLHHKPFANGATYPSIATCPLFYAAGFNAETQFIEDQPLDYTFALPARLSARLSTWTYDIKKNPFDDFHHLPYSIHNARTAQLLALVGSLWKPQFYIYFNNSAMSLRGVQTFGQYTVAVESLLDRRHYNAEVQIGRKFHFNGVTFSPKVTVGKGINLAATVEYKGFTAGFVTYSNKTLSGQRIGQNEVYSQYTLHF